MPQEATVAATSGQEDINLGLQWGSCVHPNCILFLLYKIRKTRKNQLYLITVSFSGGSAVKNPPANAGQTRHMGWIAGLERSPEEEMATHSSGQSSLVGYSLWVTESDTTQHSIAQQRICVCWFHICRSNKPWTDDMESQLQGPEHLQIPHGALEPTITDTKGWVYSLIKLFLQNYLPPQLPENISHQYHYRKGYLAQHPFPITVSSQHQKTDCRDLSCRFSLVTVCFCCGLRQTQCFRTKLYHLHHITNAPNETGVNGKEYGEVSQN